MTSVGSVVAAAAGSCSKSNLPAAGYELEWPWHSFHCTFDFGQNSSGTATFEGRAAGQPGGERVIQCPMPAAVIAAVRSGSLRTIGFSIFESRNSTAAIIDGVNLALYPKQYFDSAIHTMIKNVGGELPQWIEYHRSVLVNPQSERETF